MEMKRFTIYLTLSSFFFLFFSSLLFAQATEEQNDTITITTYYPAPFGVYRDLRTKRLVVGDDIVPNVDGVVNFQGLENDPSFRNDGALYYNSSQHRFKYYDGSTNDWKELGGGGVMIDDFRIEENFVSWSSNPPSSIKVDVYCPEGYIRTGCSGIGDFYKGQYVYSGGLTGGTIPVEDSQGRQGCSFLSASTGNAYVWAYCVKLKEN